MNCSGRYWNSDNGWMQYHLFQESDRNSKSKQRKV